MLNAQLSVKNSAAVRHSSKEFLSLGESIVRSFKKQYMTELKKNRSGEEITQLVKKKRGRPPILGNIHVDEKVQLYIKVLSKAGTPVNARR